MAALVESMFKNKGLIFYFVLISLLLHLLVILELKRIPWIQAIKKIKEPIAIDLIGPLKHGKVTAIPKYPEKPPKTGPAVVEAKPRKVQPKEPIISARAVPVVPVRPSPSPSPSPRAVPQPPPPRPAAQPAPQPKAAAAPPSPPQPAASAQGEVTAPKQAEVAVPESSASVQATPGKAAPSAPGTSGTDRAPRRLVQPSIEDLMRYARVDDSVKRTEPDQAITLDTDDLKYTSYMQGLKRRIEAVWKYPESAQKDGVSGELMMRFSITKSGRVESIELLKSSGYTTLDKAAEQALMDASPFNPLPGSWNKERFVITGTFVYKLYGLYIQ